MNCYASLFFTWLKADNGYFEYLLQKRLKPELGLEHGGGDFSRKQHLETALRLKEAGLTAAVHLLYSGLTELGGGVARRQAVDALLRAVEIANIYEPDHLIGHPEFRPGSASSSDSQHPHQPSSVWLARSLAAWEEVLGATSARLYLENTRDQTPEALLALVNLLPDRAALCFDIGHWFVAAADFQTLLQWLEQIVDRLGHLHLHDNCGRFDQHLGLGQGLIDFQIVLKFLAERNLSPTFTLEAHDLQALEQSLAWLTRLPAGPFEV